MPESKAKNALIFLLLLGVGGAGASVFVYKVIIAPKHAAHGSRSADQAGDYLAQSGAVNDEDLPEELKRARLAQQAGSQYSGVNYGKSSLGLVGGKIPGKADKDKKDSGADQTAAANAAAAGSGAGGLGTGIAGGKQLAKGFVGKSAIDKGGAGSNLSNAMQQANAGGANKGSTQVASGAGAAGQGAGGSAKGRMATAIKSGKMAARNAGPSDRRGAVADLRARRDTFARGVNSGYGTAGAMRAIEGASGIDAPAGVAPKGVDLTRDGEKMNIEDTPPPSAPNNETPVSEGPDCTSVFCPAAKVHEGDLDASDYLAMAAIGAAVGAVIGACIGGPWGALIGGVVGAVVGALAGPIGLNDRYTSHMEVTIPAEQDAQGNPKKIKSVNAPFTIDDWGWGEDTSAEVLDTFAVNENAMFLIRYKFCVDGDCEEPEFLYIHGEVTNAAGQTLGRWACLPGETDRGFKCLIPVNSQDIPSSMRSCRPIMEVIHRECSAAGIIRDRTKYESYQAEAGEGGDLKQACMKLNGDLDAQLSNCIQGLTSSGSSGPSSGSGTAE